MNVRKTYNCMVNGEEYRLRLNIGGQRRLKEKYKNTPLAVLMLATQDSVIAADVLNEALNWKGEDNTNSIRSGEEFYDLLVDTGASAGVVDMAELLIGIGTASGLVSEAQGSSFTAKFHDRVDDIFAFADSEAEENPPLAQTAD
jgi:hypothetical protein